MKLKHLLLASACALALPGVANAASQHGWYVDGAVGINWVTDEGLGPYAVAVPPFPPFPVDGFDLEHEMGFVVAGSVGHKWDNGFRLEGELAYRANQIDDFDVNSGGVPGFFGQANGDTVATSVMLNLLYDFEIAPEWTLSLGGGLGWAEVDREYKQNVAGIWMDDSDSGFAWQGIAELGYQWSEFTTVFLGYNYFNAEEGTYSNGLSGGLDDIEYTSHSVLLGVRFFWGEPAPVVVETPPPEEVPPEVAATYIVFFDFDKSNLTADAQAVVAEAASGYASTGATGASVVGHTDTVGSMAYNQGLSERRAASTEAGLVANGVPEEAITTCGRSFTDPLVPTGPGVREPQNRRAVITLNGTEC